MKSPYIIKRNTVSWLKALIWNDRFILRSRIRRARRLLKNNPLINELVRTFRNFITKNYHDFPVSSTCVEKSMKKLNQKKI